MSFRDTAKKRAPNPVVQAVRWRRDVWGDGRLRLLASVIGCNDLPLAEVLTPALTTVRLPAEHLGRLAVSAVLGDWVEQPPLPTTLVVRASTAPPVQAGGVTTPGRAG